MVKLTAMDPAGVDLLRARNAEILQELVKKKLEYSWTGRAIRTLEKERHDILVRLVGSD